MEIKDRIIRIISSEGLNSSAFADRIGVQRSSISHILSGRNKPSLDFLEKIFSNFPKYNAEWLIMGTGDIYKKPIQSTIFDTLNDNIESKKDDALKTSPSNPVLESNLQTNNPEIKKIDDALAETITKNNTNNEKPNNFDRKIEKIVIFYSDSSFTEHHPATKNQ